MKSFFSALCLFFLATSQAQDITGERIRKMGDKKSSVYLERGIFHNGGAKHKATLKAVRHSFNAKEGVERVVFDFNEAQVPSIYGYVGGPQKKITLDFFDTELLKTVGAFGNSHFVEGINFFPIDSLSVELQLKGKVVVDVFTLSNPGRFILDIKGL